MLANVKRGLDRRVRQRPHLVPLVDNVDNVISTHHANNNVICRCFQESAPATGEEELTVTHASQNREASLRKFRELHFKRVSVEFFLLIFYLRYRGRLLRQ